MKKRRVMCYMAAVLIAFMAFAALRLPTEYSSGGEKTSVTIKDLLENGAFDPALIKDGRQGREQPAATGIRLPAGLRVIEEEAFAGTALKAVHLPERVREIGSRAFAGIQALRFVYIPQSVERIGEQVFEGSCRVTVAATPKSRARAWAAENGVPFEAAPSVYPPEDRRTPGYVFLVGDSHESLIPLKTDFGLMRNSRWQKAGEIIPDSYEHIIAYHLSGRSPPSFLS